MEDSEELQSEEEEAPVLVETIQRDVAIISFLKSKLIYLKAMAHQRQDVANLQPKATETINKFEEELSRILNHRNFAKTSLQSTILRLSQDSESFPTIISLLKQYGELLNQMSKIELKDVKLKIMNKRMEYVDKLNAFKRMLEEQKEQQQSRQPHGEIARIKEKLSVKLEKVNIMRMFMLNIICHSNINYEENPEYSEMASRLLEPITFQSLSVRLTE